MQKFRSCCPNCGKLLCVLEDNSSVEIVCCNKCAVYKVMVKNGEIFIRVVKQKKAVVA